MECQMPRAGLRVHLAFESEGRPEVDVMDRLSPGREVLNHWALPAISAAGQERLPVLCHAEL